MRRLCLICFNLAARPTATAVLLSATLSPPFDANMRADCPTRRISSLRTVPGAQHGIIARVLETAGEDARATLPPTAGDGFCYCLKQLFQ